MSSLAQCPYLALRYFEEQDSHLFYGRDEHVRELLSKLELNRFVAVLGSSGSGKSSLVRAGLLPELKSGMIPSAGHRWKVIEFKPGSSPMQELGGALERELGIAHATETIAEGPLGIVRAVDSATLEAGTNVLIIADQFEEIFSYIREEQAAGRGTEAREQAQALVRRLLDAAAEPNLSIYVLLVMRSDYLGDCAQFPDLPERMNASLYLVPRLRRDQLQRAIEAPVGRDIEPAVVQRLLGEVGTDPDQLPRLQHLLSRMWFAAEGGRITLAHYAAAGEWKSGLEQHLDQVYEGLIRPQRKACRSVFQRLSEIDHGRALRRWATREQLAALCGPEAEEVVESFRREGFLRLSGLNQDTVDVMHESVLRGWPRLVGWMELESLSERRLRELAVAAREAGWRSGMSAAAKNKVQGISGLTLTNLVTWRDEFHPTSAWASRYLEAGEFEAALAFLDWCEARELEREKASRANRFRARTFPLAAAVALAGIAGVVCYWLAYVHPGTSYYASFVRRNGSYAMIGRLSNDEIVHRSESLRVTRKGFRGELLAVEAINGYGQLILDSQLDSSLFFPTNGYNGQFCRLEFTYDEKGQVVNETALDKQGHTVFMLTYAAAQAEAFKKVGSVRNSRLASVVAADGSTISSTDIHYDAQGYIDEITFLSGGATQMTFRATVIEETNTSMGPARQRFLGPTGGPIPANGAFASKNYTRDARGEPIQTMFEDASGKPVPSPDGVPPIVRWQYDQWGNQTAESYFDAANQPAVWEAAGFWKDAFALDDHGSLMEERFSDVNDKPVAQKDTGCYGYVYERDQNGNGTMKGCLDAQGSPSDYADAGYQKIAFQYDSAGRTVGNLYYGPDGKPVADKRTISTQYSGGCFGWLWGYDQNFNRTDSVCLDASGKAYDPTQLHDLAHVSHEIAFDFPRAFQLDQQLVAQDSTPAYRLDLIEASLSAEQFTVCISQAAALQDSDLNPSQIIVRDTILLACQYASGNKSAAQATAASLANRVNQMPAGMWDFDGTRYYIQTSNHFQAGSDAWDKLFLSLQNGDGQGAVNALNQLQPVLKD